jgi:GH24 family phage-related lysozyme (muramidase)
VTFTEFYSLEENAFSKIKSIGLAGLLSVPGISTSYASSNVKEPNVISVTHDRFQQSLFDYIKGNEGSRNKMYIDHKGNNTIGVGHLVLPSELKKFENRTLSENEVYELFQRDIASKIQLSKKLLGNSFDTFSDRLKISIVDGIYRGDLSGSPATIKLLKQRKFKQAAKEYINSKEYRKSKSTGTGVYKRMDKNAAAMFSETSS